MPVGKLDTLGRYGKLASLMHRMQKREELMVDLLPGLVAEYPGRRDLNPFHMQSSAYCLWVSMLLLLQDTRGGQRIVMQSRTYSL
jgi:hypothetical protein